MTATDHALDRELDALLDRLEARAVARAARRPLINVAGVEVTPYAATGRLQVNPGDTIASLWGNTTYDQTVQTYASTADRDTQWPTPKDGAMCYTLDTAAVWVRRAGAWVSPAKGLVVAPLVGPSGSTDCVALTALLTATWTTTAGRWYRIHAAGLGAIVSATSPQAILRVRDPAAVDTFLAVAAAVAVGGSVGGSGSGLWQATATGSVSANLYGSSTAGALRVSPNGCRLWVEDVAG